MLLRPSAKILFAVTGEIGNSSGKLASESDPWSSYFLAVLLVGLFGNLASMQAGPATEPEKTVLFQSGNPAGTHYRIPGLVVTPKGTVLAYAEARINTRKDFGEIEVHLRRSTDGGKTWEPSRHIAHLGKRIEGNPLKKEDGASEQTVHNPLAVVDRNSGDIVFLYGVNYDHTFVMRSSDDGKTWSKPEEITAIFDSYRDKYAWTVIATGPGHGIQLKTGRMVVPIWLAYGQKGEHRPSVAGTIYSDDAGRTWQPGQIAVNNTEATVDPNETTLTELSDGRVMLVVRSESKPNRKLLTFSADGATNWTEPVFHPDLLEPICMASIISHPAKPGTLLFCNPDVVARDKAGAEIPARKGKRENLTIKLSHDDGHTWPVSKLLQPGQSAYSDLAVLPNGTILCLYEGGDKLTLACFGLDWVETPAKP